MPTYEIQLRVEIASELETLFGLDVSNFTVSNLPVDGLLKKGDYYIPVEHILFIKEV
jgi:hypothetical protein